LQTTNESEKLTQNSRILR